MNRTAERIRNGLVAGFCAGLTGAWALLAMLFAKEPVTFPGPGDAFAFLGRMAEGASFREWAAGICAALLSFALFYALCSEKGGILKRLYRLRFPIAAALAILIIVFEINNTSLHAWRSYAWLDDPGVSGPLLGNARPIRTDEWAVWSAFTFSQGSAGFPAENGLIAGGGVDPVWISVGGVPAWTLAAVFKPQYWGFLLLGTAKGYSFLFAFRMIVLFLVSLEAAKVYTNNNLRLSFAAAALLVFAPYVQWWFSQSIAEVLIFGQGIVLAFRGFLRSEKRIARTGLACLTAWCLGCYIMVSYISWLIPGGYLVLAMCVLAGIRYRKKWKKTDGLALGIPLVAAAGVIALVVSGSWDTLMRVRGSVYPGSRVITGGEIRPGMQSGLFSILLPFVDPVISNSCECAGWITFAPAGLVLGIMKMIRRKKADAMMVILMALEAVFGLFALVGFPEWLCRATLLSQVNRPEMIQGAADTFLLIRAMAEKDAPRPAWAAAGALVCAGAGIYGILNRYAVDTGTVCLLAGITAAVTGLVFLGSEKRPGIGRRAACCLTAAALLGGAFVNPVQRGVDTAGDMALVRGLEEIGDGAEDVWFAEAWWPVTNVPLLAGKKLVDSTQPYPNPELWRRLDPDGAQEYVYNRFCHITAELTEGDNTFELLSEDHMRIFVNGDGLRKLGVTRVMTYKDYPEEWQGLRWTMITNIGGFRIYRVEPVSGAE